MQTRGLNKFILAIDEIQQIEDWSRTVKALWDEDSRTGISLQVIVLGSASLLVQQGLSESLKGRYEMHHLGHWSYSEMRECFGWTPEQYVWFGGYSGAAPLIHNAVRWKCGHSLAGVLIHAVRSNFLTVRFYDSLGSYSRSLRQGFLFYD